MALSVSTMAACRRGTTAGPAVAAPDGGARQQAPVPPSDSGAAAATATTQGPRAAPSTAGPGDEPTDPATAGRFGQVAGKVSRSVGTAQNGHLVGGVALRDGKFLRILPQTRRNGLFYGTAELVGLLERAAATLAQDQPGTVLRVANLSRQQGGDIGPSVSHNSGRDADVMFFAVDRYGTPQEPDNFCHYDSAGVSDSPAQDAGRYEFDAARNWALVRTWLSDPDVVVQWIFVAIPLRNQLLDYALRRGEPERLRRRASQVLVQPRDSSPHADHFHVRIACPPGDLPVCIDGGGVTAQARDAQIDSLLQMYHSGTPAEQRYARELLSLPPDSDLASLPPIEGED